MARGSLAPESIIANELRDRDCSHRNFCGITNFPYGTFAEVMSGRKDFEPAVAKRLLEKLQQMKELEQAIGVPPNWARTDAITNALTVRLLAKLAAELQWEQQAGLEAMADRASSAVR